MVDTYRVIEKDRNTGIEKFYKYGDPSKPWVDYKRSAYEHATILQEMADWGGRNVEIKVETVKGI